jgi:hypothetical protein
MYPKKNDPSTWPRWLKKHCEELEERRRNAVEAQQSCKAKYDKYKACVKPLLVRVKDYKWTVETKDDGTIILTGKPGGVN